MANISSQFKKASELYQRAVQQYQAKEKEQRSLIDQFKVGDAHTKAKIKPYLIALHKEMQHHQDLVDRAEAAFEKALAGEPIDLGEDTIVKNKKTGNVYSVKKANPAIHTKPTSKDIAKAKADNGGQVKAEPTKGPKLDVDKQSHIKDIPQKFRSMVSMKIDQLAKAAAEAKAKGEKAPNFNLCDITIPGTNLYCKGNKGIPREDMPQFKGYAKPGSIADKLPKDNGGEVDTEAQFKVLLKKNGVAVSEPQEVPADQLKATQTELVGAKVAGMTKALETEPNHPKITAPIYVSNDGYVLDGHHRWAAVTSAAVASGKPAMMNVRVIDMPIKDLVKISNEFADQIGIQQKKADANAEAPKNDMGVDSVVYNKRTKTVGIVRLGDERGETKTDADGNVNTDELEPYNPMKYPHQKDAKVAPSTSKEIDSRGLWKPFSQKKEVTEVTTNDWHYKAIMSLWDKGGSFTRKKLASIICKDPKATRRDVEDELRNSDYDEVTDVTDRLRIEGIIKEDMDTTADESGMFISSITSAIESAQGLQQTIQSKGENFDVPAWVQAKSALASDYLHSINRYYKGNPDQD
jgi:hypothetical protein